MPRWCSAALLACLALGCGKSDELDKLQPVKGKVIFTGKSVASGNVRAVVLYADKAAGNTTPHEPRGEIDKDGNFEVFTTAKRAGAPPGPYKVAVLLKEAPLPDSKNPYAPEKWLIDEKYGDPEKSGLKLTVVENPADGAYDLKIEN
jgi:hypothetical protein